MIAKSERLFIRRFTAQDLDLIYEINNHPECIKFNGWDSMSVEDCKNVLEKWMSGYLDHIGLGAFCVETVENHTPIGMILSRNVFEKMEFDKREHPDGPTGILYELNL